MRKIRKRILAAVLAAAVLVTIPGTASYAEAENISEGTMEQAKTDEAAEAEETENAEKTAETEEEPAEADVALETDKTHAEEQAANGEEKPEEEPPADAPKEDAAECICEILCAEDSRNGDCPLCGAEGADLSCCNGEEQEKISEKDIEPDDADTENARDTADIEQGDADIEDADTGLCAHHKEHTQDCGYRKASEDGEGNLCTYECRICPIEDLIAALPDAVTEDNTDEVRVQLDEILTRFQELTEEEQEQIDISRCLELQEVLDVSNGPAPAEESQPDLELFGQKVSSGDSGEGWSYADGVLTLDNFRADNAAECFIHVINAPLDLTIYLKGENHIETSGIISYGNVRGCMTITGDQGARLFLAGKNWNDNDIVVRGVNVDVTTQGMIFLAQGMLIDHATVNINMNGSNGYIYTTHSGLTVQNGSNVAIMNSSGDADYCVAANKADITDSTLHITNPGGFGLYVTAISTQVSEYKAVIANSTISADVLDAGIHCEDEVSVANSQITGSGQFLIRSKKAITADDSSTMEGITYEFFKSSTGAVYQVYGAHTLAAGLTVAADGSFVIPEGAALTIPNGITLENNGTMRIHDKDSLTGAGVLTGNGDFLADVNEDMISVPEGLVYTGEDYTDQITLEGTITVCGVEFSADTDGWTRHLEPEAVKDAGEYTVTYTNGDKSISKTFTVAECAHTGLVYRPLAGGGHGGICPVCKENVTKECTYSDKCTSTAGGHVYTCTVCGGTKTEAHIIKYTAAADGNTVTLSEGCDICEYENTVGSVTFAFQNLVYGNPEAKVKWTKKIPDNYLVTLCVAPGGGIWRQYDFTETEESLARLYDSTSSSKIPAGEYTLKVIFINESARKESTECSLSFTVAPAPLTEDMAALTSAGVTYNGTEQKPGVAVTQGKTMLIEGTDYDVSYARNGAATTDFTNAGTVAVSMKGKGNYKGTVTKEYTIIPAAPVVAWDGTVQELVYTGSPAVITAPAVTLANGESFSGTIRYSYKKQGETAYKNGLPVNAGTYAIKAHIDAKGNYSAANSTNELALTIKKAEGTLTVPVSPVQKTFADQEFSLGCSTNGDGKISYVSSEENVVSVSVDGTVLVKGVGEAIITAFLEEGTNHTGGANRTVRVIVEKAAAPAVNNETRYYTYRNGSNGAVAIDVAGKLPKDRGKTEYTVIAADEKSILSDVSVDGSGKLNFTVPGNQSAGDTASITVTAKMANYEDVVYALNIELVVKKAVEPQPGSVFINGSSTLTYGQALSALKLSDVIFVEQGIGTKVEGTLAWKDGSIVPDVGTTEAEWIFTPADGMEYQELAGTVPVTVTRATPDVVTPVADAITYHPSGKLGSVGLTGGSAVWTVGGSTVTVEGTWSWKDGSVLPTGGNRGYRAVFTPDDTDCYNTVECDITVTVGKAIPYIEEGKVSAAKITYGDSLSKSALTGTAQYSKSDNTPVSGSFTWKDGTIKPAVSDSGSTKYTVIFIPDEENNYSSVEWPVTLIVEKAENGSDMPSDTTNVPESDPEQPSENHTNSNTAAISRPEAPAPALGRISGAGTGNTVKPGTRWKLGGTEKPESGTAWDTRPDTKIPFIKGEDGKIGWDIIRAEEEQAKEGSVINVDMNGTTVVPEDIFDSIKGRDITITFDMGNGMLWSVDGKSITRDVSLDKTGGIDFGLEKGVSAVPVDIVDNVIGESYSIQLSLAYEGEFGFTAVLSINLGRKNAGYTANLYYYNESIGELEFICADEVAEDGTAFFAFTHASDYVIAIDGNEEEESGIGETAQPQAPAGAGEGAVEVPESAENGWTGRMWWFIAAILLAAVIGTGTVLKGRKNGKDETGGQ